MKFILNDETVENSHGFYLMNGGMRRKRFDANPVMLHEHRRADVIGRWDNIRIEGTQFIADSVFDVDDELGAKISGKVERGFLKGCSLGIRIFKATSQEVNGEWRLYVTEWEPVEGSVCAIPSNASALSVLVYDHETNQPVEESELSGYLDNIVKLSMDASSPIAKTFNTINMSFNNAFYESLSLQEGADSTAVELAVANLIAELANAKAEITTLNEQLADQQKAKVESMVQLAVDDGKILPTQKEQYIKLATADFDSVKVILDKTEARQSLRAALSQDQNNTQGGVKEISAAEWDRLHKSGELETLSLSDPKTFALLQAAKYPTK